MSKKDEREIVTVVVEKGIAHVADLPSRLLVRIIDADANGEWPYMVNEYIRRSGDVALLSHEKVKAGSPRAEHLKKYLENR